MPGWVSCELMRVRAQIIRKKIITHRDFAYSRHVSPHLPIAHLEDVQRHHASWQNRKVQHEDWHLDDLRPWRWLLHTQLIEDFQWHVQQCRILIENTLKVILGVTLWEAVKGGRVDVKSEDVQNYMRGFHLEKSVAAE